MKKLRIKALLIAILTIAANVAVALPTDTIKVVDVEEIVIIAAPKENKKLRELPASVTLLSQQQMQEAQVVGIKSLTAVVPNLFIPDYGSRLTSAIYIRGIGSRINTPSVGLYVDNIPYVNQAAFDFGYADVERIDVLRGPQSTLYGRNAMGGLIKVHTKSPFTYQGTDLRLGAATRNDYHASLTHYHRLSPRFAFSTGGYYDLTGGCFRNASLKGKKVDDGQRAGGRFRGILLPTDNWKIDLTLNYEYNDQGGYPYYYLGCVDPSQQSEALKSTIGTISNNEAGSYRRNLLNAGLNLQYQTQEFTLSAVTGYQWVSDRMFIDQDFTAAPIYNLEQKQRIHTVSEEVILKSNPGKRWQWTTGAFGFYQNLHTDGPVHFLRQGIDQMIEGSANQVFNRLSATNPQMPAMRLSVNNETLGVSGRFSTPTLSGALFHQSTFNNLLTNGLSLTLGLRLDYEKLKMNYLSASDPTDIGFAVQMGPIHITNKNPMQAQAIYDGDLTTDYLQLLPKAALQYEWRKGCNIYTSVTRGYRSGGYNIQMFSDLVSGKLSNAMMDAIAADESFSKFGNMINSMKKELPEVREATYYKPEYSWSYEIGSHLTLCNGRLTADLAAFLMDTRDQQIARFAESGLGRITVNAGRSRSLGGEAAIQAALTDALTLQAAYGYTYATFRHYMTNDRQQNEVDYRGHYVPFVPKHTLNVGGTYQWHIKRRKAWFDRVVLNAHYQAAGRIYWTEENKASQSLYGTLNGRLSLQKGNGQIDFWIRNALNKECTAFYFESVGNAFRQTARPIQAGIELRCRF